VGDARDRAVPHVHAEEPALLAADCQGVEQMVAAGVEVVELPGLAAAARAVNVHLHL
jgi:diaminohydroxyphosphoribosylaminopyrimidine deaminase/5-amino-6-(5-phosphoribosylamino)uracil reductase